jgi:hypothetical protein
LSLQEDLQGGEDIATCPSCSLRIRVIYDETALEKFVVAGGGAAKVEAEAEAEKAAVTAEAAVATV